MNFVLPRPFGSATLEGSCLRRTRPKILGGAARAQRPKVQHGEMGTPKDLEHRPWSYTKIDKNFRASGGQRLQPRRHREEFHTVVYSNTSCNDLN